jgi:hypothetical protein
MSDFVLCHPSRDWLRQAHAGIEAKLAELHLQLNPRKTILQPIERGIDFVGQVIKPHRRTTRPRTLRAALQRVATVEPAELQQTANSYFGLLSQASHSHHERALLANAVRRRGRAVKADLTKTYAGGVR